MRLSDRKVTNHANLQARMKLSKRREESNADL